MLFEVKSAPGADSAARDESSAPREQAGTIGAKERLRLLKLASAAANDDSDSDYTASDEEEEEEKAGPPKKEVSAMDDFYATDDEAEDEPQAPESRAATLDRFLAASCQAPQLLASLKAGESMFQTLY